MAYKSFGERRSLRLRHYDYSSPRPVHVVIGTYRARNLLQGDELLQELMGILARSSTELRVRVYAFCFMPDYLHLLIAPEGEHDIVEFVRRFKGLCTRAFWRHGGEGKLWQREFYDHILRKGEDVGQVARYILDNPVRAGLVERRKDYPYAGSFVFDL